MRPRTIKMSVSFMGMTTPIAEAKITSFARIAEVKDYVDRLCPKCLGKPAWKGGYVCGCGASFNHWSQLKEVIKGSTRELSKTRLTEKGEDVLAKMWRMPAEKFKEYGDATISEYGLTVKDSTSAKNLKKLLIAVRKVGQVVILTWAEEYEQRIALLTVSESARVVIREIMPLNLGSLEETLRVTLDVPESEITEAEMFVKTLPEATEDTLKVQDWRTTTIPEVVTAEKAKVQDLDVILATLPPAK